MTRSYKDSTGTCCPHCQSTDHISYTVIPASQLSFVLDEEQHTYHYGPQRDYMCRNCDCEWLMGSAHVDEETGVYP